MNNEEYHLHDCAHCSGTGTCNHGENGDACAACVKKQELKRGNYMGLACGTCGGLGKTDTLTYRMNNRATPLLAISIICFCFILIFSFGLTKNPHFSEILTFSGTLVGAVTGHYFGKRSEQRV
ncbi:hypothetical protein [Cycloclasticus pugetii]|jgi:hypothetical protein|uniref:hypothetical protein n=1 Tax=Cycloclasticus pugetii TaxID=34068 RepID=UPI00035D20BD|nr:hypothetical protein [Cycloclasticus pugetii]